MNSVIVQASNLRLMAYNTVFFRGKFQMIFRLVHLDIYFDLTAKKISELMWKLQDLIILGQA